MKTIGLIGGMSWESTAEYYRIINQEINKRLGGLHSGKCLLYSFDFAEIEALQVAGEWQTAGQEISKVASSLENSGADLLLLCTNTMHKVYEMIQTAVYIPVVHIADATANVIRRDNLNRVGLLGTKFTMQERFYKGRLEEIFGLDVLVPDDYLQDKVHEVIYKELVLGIIKPESKEIYKKIIDELISDGAEGIILGCTEIGLLIHQDDFAFPLYDTTNIHAVSAVDMALG